MIRTYWWRKGPGAGNFGDMLTLFLCAKFSGQSIEFAEPHQADILAIGSILDPHFWQPGSWDDFRGFVWGTGSMFGRKPMVLPHAQVLAVRGRLTREHLGFAGKESAFLGDPGLLCSLFVRRKQPRFKLGVVPHFTERDHPLVRQIVSKSPEIALIDACAPIPEVLEAIASCEAIVASALHGLVVADALEIPNEWFRLNTGTENVQGTPEFKYRDYYSVYGLDNKTYLTLTPQDTLDSILERFGPYSRPGLTSLQRNLLESFPYRPHTGRGP